jgi:caspase domain-containing protein
MRGESSKAIRPTLKPRGGDELRSKLPSNARICVPPAVSIRKDAVRRLSILIVATVACLGSALPALGAIAPANGAALLIGVDRFQGRTRPNIGAVGDAMDKRDLLIKHGWRADQIRLLVNEAATQAAIREGMSWLTSRCSGTDSYCVFHYSGHVKQMSGDEGLNEFLWPHDNRFISDTEFAGFMRQLHGYAWIDISGCEAAGFDNAVASDRRLFTAASQETEKGYEYPGWSNSVWTGLLVDEGMLKGKADANGDGHVTLSEAIPYAVQRAPGMTTGQPKGPQHPYVAGGSQGNWFPVGGARPLSLSTSAPARRCLLFLCF